MGRNIVMNTFSGRYLLERSNKNIGHENINFFKPNGCDDKFLLWFNCDGIINKSMIQYDGNITLLMVTNFANEKDKFRVLALAKHCHIVNGATIPTQKNEAKVERHRKFLKQFPNAAFGSTRIENIFLDNTYQGNNDGFNTLSTFWTSKDDIFVPSDANLTIQIRKVEGADIKQNMANEKMRMFIEDDATFESLIDDINWIGFDAANNCLPRFPMNSNYYKEDETLFTATRNEKDELTLSNIIAFSLSKSQELLNNLLSFLIPNSNFVSAEYLIKREEQHVDLTILLPDKTIIIENKIDSTIVEYGNDKKDLKDKILKVFNKEYKPSSKIPTSRGSLIKYNEKVELYKKLNDKIDNYLSLINNGERLCQLSKYYIQSHINAELSNRGNLPIFYFFLVPDYTANKFNVNQNGFVDGYAFSNQYKLIKYSDLLNIFNDVINYPYRDDIIKEFEMLSSKCDDFDQNRQIYSFLKKAGL